jgi:hypothetical protein
MVGIKHQAEEQIKNKKSENRENDRESARMEANFVQISRCGGQKSIVVEVFRSTPLREGRPCAHGGTCGWVLFYHYSMALIILGYLLLMRVDAASSLR